MCGGSIPSQGVKMNTKITGQEAYDMMLAIESNKCGVRDHFHWNSPLWRTIRDHIESNECSIILKPDNVMTYRGTGQAIRLIKTHTYHTEYKTDPSSGKTITLVPDFFCMELEIELYSEDEDRTFNRDFKLNIPIDLLIDFTQEKFKKWVKSESVSNLDKIVNQTANRIKEIVDGLPNDVIIKVLNQLHETVS